MAAPPVDEILKETGRYERVRSLGIGASGFVELARSTQNKQLSALKFLKRTEITKHVEAEILNHSLLRHAHVIQFKEVFLLRDYICIVMEYANGGSLFQFVQKHKQLKEPVARWFFQQLMIGVDFCHKMGIANRDMKLENTLLQTIHGLPLPLVKICDFGYSKADFKSAAKTKVGTLTYMAPEVLVNREGKYDGKTADIWSCGVMLYIMLYGKYPFHNPAGQKAPRATDIMFMMNQMVARKYELPDTVELSPEGRDLLTRLLLPTPKQRITIDEVFKHPWFLINLPPTAGNMNSANHKPPTPPGYQTPEQIRTLLNEAKGLSAQASMDALDRNIDEAIQEEDPDDILESAISHNIKEGGHSSVVAEFLQENVDMS